MVDPHPGLVAFNRFGLGARGGHSADFAAATRDPRGFLKAELALPGAGLLESPTLMASPALVQRLFAEQDQQKAMREAKAAGPPMAEPAAAQPVAPLPPAAPPPNVQQEVFRAEALARVQHAALAQAGLVERLVMFWSNHFCISAAKSPFGRISAGAFEREAIRPHVLGRFADMLLAVERHPAMLQYLDNQQSFGPNSRAGLNGKRGLNENLAREIMELHVMGVGSGYAQDDVTALARILTGWTNAGRDGRLGEPGGFAFFANAHEPGPQTLLGRVYADTGLAQGETALADLARGPACARRVAEKLARHFVADEPPPALVTRLAATFLATDGDLRTVTTELIDAPEAWRAPLQKMRTPYDMLIAATRALDAAPTDPGPFLGGLNAMGMPLWAPPGPNGFHDTVAAWAAPENMKLRLDIAQLIAIRAKDLYDPSAVLDAVAGTAASPATRTAVARAESRRQGLAILLMSPEMQRR